MRLEDPSRYDVLFFISWADITPIYTWTDVFWEENICPLDDSCVNDVPIFFSQFSSPKSLEMFSEFWIIFKAMLIFKNNYPRQNVLPKLFWISGVQKFMIIAPDKLPEITTKNDQVTPKYFIPISVCRNLTSSLVSSHSDMNEISSMTSTRTLLHSSLCISEMLFDNIPDALTIVCPPKSWCCWSSVCSVKEWSVSPYDITCWTEFKAKMFRSLDCSCFASTSRSS